MLCAGSGARPKLNSVKGNSTLDSCRYTATDHKLYDPSLESCPFGARCRNCMPLNDSDPGTCWAVKTPILYGLQSYGQVQSPKGQEVQVRPWQTSRDAAASPSTPFEARHNAAGY